MLLRRAVAYGTQNSNHTYGAIQMPSHKSDSSSWSGVPTLPTYMEVTPHRCLPADTRRRLTQLALATRENARWPASCRPRDLPDLPAFLRSGALAVVHRWCSCSREGVHIYLERCPQSESEASVLACCRRRLFRANCTKNYSRNQQDQLTLTTVACWSWFLSRHNECEEPHQHI